MTNDLIIIGIVITDEPKKQEKVEKEKMGKLEEEIQERILALSDDAITFLMQVLHLWDIDKKVMTYCADNIGKLVTYGNDMGWDVELNIENGRDYHIVGKHVVSDNKYLNDKYVIYGIHDEFDEWADLLNLYTLVGEIVRNPQKLAILHYIEILYKARK